MNDDTVLLRRYAETRRDADFTALVEHHLGLVYHAALRQLAGDTHHARDAAQVVFTDLARKAPALAARPFCLSGWLHTATRHACARIRRAEHRRRNRDTEAAHMTPDATHPEPADSAAADWARLQPVLDDALHALSARDRDAVLWRFFEGQAYAKIGARLAISEDAARHRVDRALEKLRVRLSCRGVASTATALGLALGSQAGLVPPAGLAATVSTTALADLAAAGGLSGLALASSIKTALAIGGVAVAVLGAGYLMIRPAPTKPVAPAHAPASPLAAPSPLTAADLLGPDYIERLRGVSAEDYGRLLVELWNLGTPAARARFREVFDRWCLVAPDAASRWAVVTRTTKIGAPDGAALRKQAALAWADRDLDNAYAWALAQPDEARFDGLASELLRHLAASDPAGAIDLAHLGTREMRRATLYDVFATWARSAPLTALAALKNDPEIEEADQIANRIHSVWAQSDPASATRHLLSAANGQSQKARDNTTSWYMSLADYKVDVPAVARATLSWWNDLPGDKNPRDFPDWGMGEALVGWSSVDSAQTLAFIDTIKPEALRQLLLDRVIGASGLLSKNRLVPLDPFVALALCAKMSNEQKRANWSSFVVQKWAKENPESALSWSREQPDEALRAVAQAGAFRAIAAQEPETALAAWKTSPPNEDLALSVAEGWAENDPAAAVAWFSSQYPKPAPKTCLQNLLTSWMKKDPEAATTWAEKNGREQAKQDALQATQAVLLPEGLAYTVRLAPDSESRVEWLKARAAWWLEKDRAAATKFLSETPLLTPEEKTRLINAQPERW